MKNSGLAVAMSTFVLPAGAVTFSDFSSVGGFSLNGSAAAAVTDDFGRSVLRLTSTLSQGGSAFLTAPIALTDGSRFQASFSTAFNFRISAPSGISDADGQGADGLVFVVQTVANNVGGIGGGIGYLGIDDSVGIEFDTWFNGDRGDINGNHVGIDVGGVFPSVAQTPIPTRMNNSADWYAWVDYDGPSDLLEVRLSQTPTRPTLATLSQTIDLVTELGVPNAYIGFTSGTGGAGGRHNIISWQFESTFAPIQEVPSGQVPEAGTMLVGGAVVGLAGLTIRRRLKRA